MALIDKEHRTLHVKIVYYGPGMAGKTTNLQHLHAFMPEHERGDLLQITTEKERTLFFACTPPTWSIFRTFHIRTHVYTVPGSVVYPPTRTHVLQGVDGVVFVVDSQREYMQLNLCAFQELLTILSKDPRNKAVNQIPIVLQYNKQDAPTARSIDELHQRLNVGNWPEVSAIARQGIGVQEAFDILCIAIENVLREETPQTSTLEWRDVIERIAYSSGQEEKTGSTRNAVKIVMMLIGLACIAAITFYILTQ